jgi:hypothetical protein
MTAKTTHAMAMVSGGGTRTDEPTIAPRGDEESAPRRESHERAAVSTIRTGALKAWRVMLRSLRGARDSGGGGGRGGAGAGGGEKFKATHGTLSQPLNWPMTTRSPVAVRTSSPISGRAVPRGSDLGHTCVKRVVPTCRKIVGQSAGAWAAGGQRRRRARAACATGGGAAAASSAREE